MKLAVIICLSSYFLLALMAVLAITGPILYIPMTAVKIAFGVLITSFGFSFGFINRRITDNVKKD